MLFNSFEFIFIFLPVTFLFWRTACRFRRTRLALIFLMLASFFFYGYWNPPYLLLLLASISVNYVIQDKLAELNGKGGVRLRKLLLFFGAAVDLSLIGYYKYANFFAQNISYLFGAPFAAKEIFLPLGISFFTFQQIAALADTYKGRIGRLPFCRYALFVSFFPQLIAGPIVLADDLMPQFESKKTFCLSWKSLCAGLTLFSLGLFKKVIIADGFSPWAAAAFGAEHPLTLIEAWGGALAYTFQIYFDFSGYSDMALGLGRFFNIKLPLNFNSPYKALSIIDFWRRWHMTLSRFLRDYLYIPLGGNRKGRARRYVNLVLTMLIGGLWHGAGWTFVIWGGLHGLFLAVNHLWRELRLFPVPKAISWCVTFTSVTFAWVFFRAESLKQAVSVIKGMLGMNGIVIPPVYLPASIRAVLSRIGISFIYPEYWVFSVKELAVKIFAALIISVFFINSAEFSEREHFKGYSSVLIVLFALAAALSALTLNNITEFLYFQF